MPPFCPCANVCTVTLCKEPLVCTISENNHRIAYLIQNGVKVFHVGETITLVLPADLVFSPDSSSLNPCYLSVLKAASDLVFCYEKTTVRIAVYSDSLDASCRNKILTQAQAQSVAKLFWCNGIDARLLYAVGYGSACPIASNQTAIGRAQNRRIEICFKYIPPYGPGC